MFRTNQRNLQYHLKFENCARKPEKVVGMKMMQGSNDFCREMQHQSCASLTNPLKPKCLAGNFTLLMESAQ